MPRSLPRVVAAFYVVLVGARAQAAIDPVQAQSVFDQAHAICVADDGALWGHTLCGPMILVDPDDRAAVANQADAQGVLVRDGAFFTTTLPGTVTVSDTTIDWAGTRWCELLWPWPMREDDDMRHVTLAHEMFHRIQSADLHLEMLEGDNRHLDSLDGRYLMELEWRALAVALQAPDAASRTQAIADARLFRAERYRRFPAAPENEARLESSEGIAEYTGVRIGLHEPGQRTAYALRDLNTGMEAPSLVRAFAYATGPAYGLLLDQADPDWRTEFLKDPLSRRLDEWLGIALGIPDPDPSTYAVRAAVYDADGSLKAREVARDHVRQVQARAYRHALVDGPVLVLPLEKSSYEFKPQTLVALEGFGTVYPTMTLRDRWGTLSVESGGVLMRDQEHVATISSRRFDRKALSAPGFHLALNSGWRVAPGTRKGDLKLEATP